MKNSLHLSIATKESSNNDEIDVRVDIEKIENGYLVTKTWETKSEEGRYEYHNKKWYMKENPIESSLSKDSKDLLGIAKFF